MPAPRPIPVMSTIPWSHGGNTEWTSPRATLNRRMRGQKNTNQMMYQNASGMVGWTNWNDTMLNQSHANVPIAPVTSLAVST